MRGNDAAEAGSETGEDTPEESVSQTMIVSEPIAEPAAALANREEAEPRRPAQAKSDDEESIESYMDRLMKRVRGDSTPVAGKSNAVAQPAAVAAPQSAISPDAGNPARLSK